MRLYQYAPYRTPFDLVDSFFAPVGAASGAPAYNVERKDENNYGVVLAVPGYSQDDVELTQEDNVLTVTGKPQADTEGVAYTYRGIPNGGFERKFELGDHVKVTAANLTNGLLKITLVREVPEEQKPRKITIGLNTPAVENRRAA